MRCCTGAPCGGAAPARCPGTAARGSSAGQEGQAPEGPLQVRTGWGGPRPRTSQPGSARATGQIPPARGHAGSRTPVLVISWMGLSARITVRSPQPCSRPGPFPGPALAPESGRRGVLSPWPALCCPCPGPGGRKCQAQRPGAQDWQHGGRVHVCARVPVRVRVYQGTRVCAHEHKRVRVCACVGGVPTPAPRERPHLPGDALLREPLPQGVEGPGSVLRVLGVLQVCAAWGALSPPLGAHLQEAQQGLCGAVQGQDLGRSTRGRPLPQRGGGPAPRVAPSPGRRGSPGASPGARRPS